MERLTRYWIVFQHHLNNNEDFVRDDGKQNTEQLTNTLVPLKENYAYAHMLGQHGLCVHEPEFHAYSVLLTGDIKQATKGHAGVSHSPEVRCMDWTALKRVRTIRTHLSKLPTTRGYNRCAWPWTC